MTDLLPHQQRVVAERAALAENLEKLRAFIGSDAAKQLPPEESDALGNQEFAMTRYLHALDQRLKLWGVASA